MQIVFALCISKLLQYESGVYVKLQLYLLLKMYHIYSIFFCVESIITHFYISNADILQVIMLREGRPDINRQKGDTY
jgi:hypothetical protein